jgi:hypothetical protein|tara:strand:- start:12123 stop:13715 length:1593 start_codon:yes stop_codon:yes gene_type:complete
MANIVTDKNFCTENSGSTYSVAGVPLTIATLFTKTFTVTSGYVFKTAPSINFSEVSDPKSYTVAINDTGSIAGGNLTVRSFVVKYKYPLKLVTNDTINFSAKAELNIAASTSKIYNFNIASGTLLRSGETRQVSIYGDPGATLTFDVKNASNSSIRGGASTVTIPSDGLYLEDIIFPASISTTSYSVIFTEINNSFLTMTSPQTVTINQYATTVLSFGLTEGANDFIVQHATRSASGNVGDRSAFETRLSLEQTHNYWTITSQSSVISLKNINFTANDWTGTTAGTSNTLTGGSIVNFGDLEAPIYPTITAVTYSSATQGATIVLLADSGSAYPVYVGMRVTGSGITRSGASSLIVINVSVNSNNLTTVTCNQTSGGTIAAGTTLTFHSVAHVYGQLRVLNFGTSNQNCNADAAGIIAFNEAPTAASQANVAATRSVAKEITLTGADPEGDALTFTITKLPGNGTLQFTNSQNQSQTVNCSDNVVSHVIGNSKVVAYTASSTGGTTLTFKVNDGQQDSGTGTININVTGG